MDYSVIYHKDGACSLVEESSNRRTFVPFESTSELINYIKRNWISVPMENIQTL